jgi:hypothetical protein
LQVEYLVFWPKREFSAGDFDDLDADEAMANSAMPATVGRLIGDRLCGAPSGNDSNPFV